MGKKITITDVAEALGISKTTVSRAISGKGRVGENTKSKVLGYIEEHNYSPNPLAKGLAEARTYNIALSIPSEVFSHEDVPFFQTCLIGMCKAAEARDYDVILTMNDNKDLTQLKRIIKHRKVDGIIVTRTLANDEQVELLKNSGIPFVTIGSYNGRDVIQIDNDHEAGCEELTERLIAKGINKIALLSGDSSHIVTQNRTKGFLNGMKNSGVGNAGSFIFPYDKNRLEETLKTIMSRHFECIICMDDSIALAVLDKLTEMRVSVPRDIKIASFYSSPALEKHVPKVTALDYNPAELGSVAVETLIKAINEENVEQKTLIGHKVVFGKTTE